MKRRRMLGSTIAAILAFSALLFSGAATYAAPEASTPIKHLVVIFQENVSFDHYFGTYPNALNPQGEPSFTALPNTPSVNGLTAALLNNNPNLANPKRLDRILSDLVTCDQNHGYTAEQQAFDQGKMDMFVQSTSGGSCTDKNIVMDYYDGNTVTALWNYAQHFAMSDNSFSSTFGPSTPGALNLISGQTHGATTPDVANTIANGTIIGDPRPLNDDCSPATSTKTALSNNNKNVGDLLNAQDITWGWFQGGFKPSSVVNGVAVCATAHTNIAGATVTDYIPHHEPFQYYASTANPRHLRPTSFSAIGQTDRANHQYDIGDFRALLHIGRLPAVSFLKAPGIQDGHPGYSSPLDEQDFLVTVINALQRSAFWDSTAVVILYDDSDGWYDHQMSPIVNHSETTADQLTGNGTCGDGSSALPGINPRTLHAQGRCGYGPRTPTLVVSAWSKVNFVDHTLTDQASILRFIEDNWLGGRRLGAGSFDALAGRLDNMFDFHHLNQTRLILNPATGERVP